MGLLTPLALVALGALAVPVWIHLSQRDRKEEIRFPSLMFLERIPYKAVRRQTIRNWPLFLLRSLVLALLVAAFARPFLGSDTAAVSLTEGPVDRVVLLDRSASMSVAGRWSAATRMAREALRSAPAGSRVALAVFDSRVSVSAPLAGDPSGALAVLDTLRTSDGATRLAPALRAAAAVLDQVDRPREVVLITDLQRSGWPEGSRYVLPEGIVLSLRTPNDIDETPANPHLSGLRVTSRQDGDTARVRVSALMAGLAGTDEEAPGTVSVALRLGAEEVARAEVTLDGRDAIPVTLEGPLIRGDGGTGGMPGSLVMESAGPAWDDTLRFVAEPAASVPVVVVDDSDGGETSLFLSRALEVGTNPGFPHQVLPSSRLTSEVLASAAAVVLNDIPAPGGGGRGALEDFLSRGGGIFVVLGPDANGAWPNWLVPGTLSPPRDLGDVQGVPLAALALDHPILEPFREAGAGEFSRARFFRSRGLPVGDSTLIPVASFISGDPALAEVQGAQGRVVLWSSTLDDFWTDLPRHAVFLPFVHQVIQYVAGYRPPVPAYAVGTPVGPVLAERGLAGSASDPTGAADPTALGPQGQPATIMDRAGFYVVEVEGARRVLAANLDPTESDLASLDADEFVREVAGPGDANRALTGGEALTAEDREARQAIWRSLLVLMMVLLIVETALANRPRARMT
jgi:hypothetical protein